MEVRVPEDQDARIQHEGGKVRGVGLTCQMKRRGALDAFTDGRYGAMWKVGFSSCSRFRLTSLHTGASGSTCARGCESVQVSAANHPYSSVAADAHFSSGADPLSFSYLQGILLFLVYLSQNSVWLRT